MSDIRIGIILASTREGRRGAGYAAWIQAVASRRERAAFELIDLRDYALPAYVYDKPPTAMETAYTDPVARRWSELIHGLDGYIVVTPEYNHGYPGQLKNALDHVHAGWFYKPIAFVSYGGGSAGARAVEQLRQVACELRMVPVRGEVNVRLIGVQLDEAGHPTDPYYARTSDAMLDQLLWWAHATKHARAAEPPPV
jgi:NAD(P)H-dependent FMN reductase